MTENLQPTLGFLNGGSYQDTVEVKSVMTRTLDVDGDAWVDNNLTVNNNMSVNGNTTIGNASTDRIKLYNQLVRTYNPLTLNPATSVTLTGAQVLQGIIVANPTGGNVTLTLPALTGVNGLLSSMTSPANGDFIELRVYNLHATNTVTIAAPGGANNFANTVMASGVIAGLTSKVVILQIVDVTGAANPSGLVYC